MKYKDNMRIATLGAWILVALFVSTTSALAGVTPELQRAIRQATFEVVRKKPEHDPLQYEKPLPLELLPYTERTDAYESIGTAFALGNNTYVTAAHVLAGGVNSQYGPPSLRASNGAVYAIDKIIKYSGYQDFAVFSSVKGPETARFEVNRTPQIDDPVLAVGNALGDGIVIRDGLFTSETAEDQDGRWKWIRFSAAASPGNSGGPLLDVSGKVIGIVIGKSPNENLNYSLPITQVLDAVDGRAVFDQRVASTFPILRATRTYSYKDEFKLPLGWSEFVAKYEAQVTRHSVQARDELLDANKDRIFPNGAGTESLLFDLDQNYMPRLIAQQTDNSWFAAEPGYQSAELPGDGYVRVGSITNDYLSLIRLHRSDNATDDAFYSDSKGFMDLVLKGLDITRPVGSDKVRVTSLGPALSDSMHTDIYGRKWQQRVWPLPFLDAYVVGMLLPTPDGYAALLQYTPSQQLKFASLQAVKLTDFVSVSYWGTMAQWQAYLQRRMLLPAGLASVKLQAGSNMALATGRFTMGVPAAVMSLDQQSELGVGMGFIRDNGRIKQDVAGVWLYKDPQRRSYVELLRQPQPPTTAKLELRNKFSNMRSRRSPYDADPSRERGDTYSVSTAISAPGKSADKISTDIVYALTLALEGHSNDASLLSKQGLLLSTTHVLEHGEVEEQAEATSLADNRDDNLSRRDGSMSEFLAMIDRQSQSIGRDIRGRLLAQDIRELIVPMMTVSAQQKTSEGWSALQSSMQAVNEYWALVPRLMTNRGVWSEFLSSNGYPIGMPHTLKVIALESRLTGLLAGVPSAEWASLTDELTIAYIDERKALAANADIEAKIIVPRKSVCPAAAQQPSKTGKVAFAPNTEPLPDTYPPASLRRNEEGAVYLVLNINETGCAVSAAIKGSSGFKDLDAAALMMYESMRFLPAAHDGKPVVDSVILPVNYRFPKRPSGFPVSKEIEVP